jgi:hypothetical protein
MKMGWKRLSWTKEINDTNTYMTPISLVCLVSLMEENEFNYVSIRLITWYTC